MLTLNVSRLGRDQLESVRDLKDDVLVVLEYFPEWNCSLVPQRRTDGLPALLLQTRLHPVPDLRQRTAASLWRINN